MWLAAAILWGLGSPGEPPPVDLQWETVPGCPDRMVVEQELRGLLDASPSTAAVEARGRLTSEQGSYRLQLEVVVDDQRETRALVASDCMALSRAGVLVVAVTLDALATARRVETASRPLRPSEPVEPPLVPEPRPILPAKRSEPEPTAAAERARPAAVARTEPSVASVVERTEPSTERPRPRGGILSVGGGASSGLTPGLAGGLEGALTWRVGAARLSAGGFHWFARTTELQPEVGVEAALSGGLLRGCLAFGRARWEAPLCASVELGAMHGGGIGASVRRREVQALWVGASAGVGVQIALGARFGLWARADAVWSMRRPAMFLVVEEEPEEAFRVAPVGARLLIGPHVRLW